MKFQYANKTYKDLYKAKMLYDTCYDEFSSLEDSDYNSELLIKSATVIFIRTKHWNKGQVFRFAAQTDYCHSNW